MAFSTTGLIELEKKLYGLESDVEEVRAELLEVGGSRTTKFWKEDLEKNTMPNGTLKFYLRYRGGNLTKVWYRSRSTGAMNRNTYNTAVTHLTDITDIYPQGTVKRGNIITRNATKAFVMNYGRKNMIPKNFLPEIEENVAAKAIPEMQEAFNKYLKSKGLV